MFVPLRLDKEAREEAQSSRTEPTPLHLATRRNHKHRPASKKPNPQRSTDCRIPQMSKQTKRNHPLFTHIYSNHKLMNKSKEWGTQNSGQRGGLWHGRHVGVSWKVLVMGARVLLVLFFLRLRIYVCRFFSTNIDNKNVESKNKSYILWMKKFWSPVMSFHPHHFF